MGWFNDIVDLSYGNPSPIFRTNKPKQPNLNTAAGQLAEMEANYLPQLLALQSEAELGTSGLIPGFVEDNGLYYQLNTGYTTKKDNNGNTIYLDKKGNQVPLSKAVDLKKPVDKSQAIADFSGYSTADIQNKISKQLAEGQLANAKEYDPQFIKEALVQEKELDPNRVAAREALYNTIQEQIKNPPISPVANEMERQVQEKVNAGSGLTPEQQAMLDRSVNATGEAGITGTSGNAPDFSNALTTGFAGEQRALDNASAGTRWLASGLTPEDVRSKAEEQNIRNLSEFYSGSTPESAFSALRSAGATPTPNAGNPQLPQLPSNLAEVGSGAAINQYGQQVQQALNTPNPWAMGIGDIFSLARSGAAFAA